MTTVSNDISLYSFAELKIMENRAKHRSPSPIPFTLEKVQKEIERRSTIIKESLKRQHP